MSGGIAALAVAFGEYLGRFLPFFSTCNVLAVGARSVAGRGRSPAVRWPAALAILLLTVRQLARPARRRRRAEPPDGLQDRRQSSCFVGSRSSSTATSQVRARRPLPAVPAAGRRRHRHGGGAVDVTTAGTEPPFRPARCATRSAPCPSGSSGDRGDRGRSTLLINLVYFRALSLDEMASTRRIGETAATPCSAPAAAGLIPFAVVISTLGLSLGHHPLQPPPLPADGARRRVLQRPGRRPPAHSTPPGRSLWAQSLWAVAPGDLGHLRTDLHLRRLRDRCCSTSPPAPRSSSSAARGPTPNGRTGSSGYPVVPALFILASVAAGRQHPRGKPVESLLGLGFLVAGSRPTLVAPSPGRGRFTLER